MSIRLNKAIRELNIGLNTAVEFLSRKPELGEVKSDPSCKISDEQYNALSAAFAKDKEVRDKAEQLLKKPKGSKQQKAPKTVEAAPKAEEKKEKRQEFKPLGKIDLDALNGKKKPEAKAEKKAEPAPAKVEPKKAEPQKAEAPKVQAPKPEPKKAEKPKETKEAAPVEVKEEKPAVKEVEVFTTKNERKMLGQKMNVVGKIDLDALNQSTRPKKKTKEERRKEREEKAQQARDAQKAANGERKKRNRMNKERVDINAAANQPQGNGKKNNNNQNQQGGGKKKNKNKQNNKPQEVNEEDVARQVKETLARLTSKSSQNKKGAKYRKEKRDAAAEKRDEELLEQELGEKVLKLTEFVTVSELATMMNVPVTKLIGTLMSIGVMVSINQRLDAETINIVAEEFGFTTEYVSAEVQEAVQEAEDDENDLVSRAPIVTVMGHVDHGKTSLLDYIRQTNVIAGEAGGITQHIGAYNVKLEDGRKITFLDTPGHEAFTAMRARGTQVTDIAIIIIAADDSIMPTTKEAIAHAQAANVPMVFAINKIDKPGANPDKIRQDLAAMNLLVEEWGGKYQCQEISAKKGTGVAELLEKVLLEAEMLDLKANPNRKATGSVI